MLEETIETINQFETEMFPEAESSKKGNYSTMKPRTIIRNKLSNWEQMLKSKERVQDPRIEKKFDQLKQRLNQIQQTYNNTAALTDEELEEHLALKQKVT